jgi:arabinose-5-phosphate isomerase
MNKKNYISLATKAANLQINELKKVKKVFNKSFVKAVDYILSCKGKIIFAGVGKSGLIAKKISATFSSVGIPSFFCDPTQASHGDMGQIEKKDLLIIFSNSGNTFELTNMLKFANRFGIKIIGVASKLDSLLLKASDIKLLLPKVKESDPTGMVPTSSTSISLLLGDCLATTIMYKKKFSKEKFKLYHSGGKIGDTLLLSKDIMIVGKKLPVIDYKKNLDKALKIINQKKLGIVVVLKNKFIEGLVTDGDLRRGRKFLSKKNKLQDFMTKKPFVVNENMSAEKALNIMNEKKITSLLIVSDNDYKKKKKMKLKGIIQIHFLLKSGVK